MFNIICFFFFFLYLDYQFSDIMFNEIFKIYNLKPNETLTTEWKKITTDYQLNNK